MKTRLFTTAVLVLFSINGVFGADGDIKLNSLGFLSEMPKQATVSAECSSFMVKRASDNVTVYTGRAAGPFYQQDVDEEVWIADFTQVTAEGQYYLDIPGVGRSIEFEIGESVYDFAFYTAMRGFYLWRCGTAVEGEHDGQLYAHDACHLEDAYQDYIGIEGARKDGTGGWHDAGDYGKYTVNAGVTLGSMFLAWDHFQDRLVGVSLDIPDTAPGYPDYLKELKWEIDWLLTMQYPDNSGRVSHKLTRLNFSGFIMPAEDLEPRYYTEWSSAATADFAAVLAMAARYFEPYDAGYARTCLEAATRSYLFLKANPEDKRFVQGDFSTGGYQTRDPDDRLWAAAEMWETTGERQYLRDFEALAAASENKIDEDWDWGNLRNLGMFTYLLSAREGKDAALAEDVRQGLLAIADSLVAKAERDIYSRPMAGRYYWGCNGTVARQTLILQAANIVAPDPDYVKATLDAIGHLFGRNYYGRSQVTGLGQEPPLNPHDRRSGADGIEAPWPGYLVGGGLSATGWNDEEEDYRTNEIAINWQAALIYALAGFVSAESR